MIGNQLSPQKENTDYPMEQIARNPNRQFFQKLANNNGNQQAPTAPLNSRQGYNQQYSSGNRFDQQNSEQQIGTKGCDQNSSQQQQVKNSQQMNRKKIFSSNDDAQSVASIQTAKIINQQPIRQNQILAPQNYQNAQNFQNSNMNNNFQQPPSQNIKQSTEQNGFTKQVFPKNQSELHMNQQGGNINQLYSDLLQQYNQLQEAKSAAEVTHNLEIEDTKKHYEFKLNESLKKHQELLLKLQNLQQGNSQIQTQTKTLQEDLKRKDEEILQIKQQLTSNESLSEEFVQLKQSKAQQDKIIADGKIYIEKIKTESEQKSQQMKQLQSDIKDLQMNQSHLIEQLEGAKKNTSVMRTEIDQLIACNLDFQKRIEFEKKDKEEKIAEYQKILSRVNQSYSSKAQDEEKTRKISDLEINLKKMIDRNSEFTIELKEKTNLIERMQQIMKSKGIQLDIFNPNKDQINKFNNNMNINHNNLGLQQITEEQEEDSQIDINKRSFSYNDLNTNNIDDIKYIAKQLIDDNDSYRQQISFVKNQNSVLNKEIDILRANSQLQIQNPQLSGQTYIDRIKELNNNISQLQKDKETLIYENTVIVNQMKKERQNREDEVKLLQNQIRNYQKLATINSSTQPQPVAQIIQNVDTTDQSNTSLQQPLLNVSTLSTFSNKSSIQSKPPISQPIVSNIIASPNLPIGRLSDVSSNSNSLQRFKQGLISQQPSSNIINTQQLKRTSSYDGNLNSNGSFTPSQTLHHQPSLTKLNSNIVYQQEEFDMNKGSDSITQQQIPFAYEQHQLPLYSQLPSNLYQQPPVIYQQQNLQSLPSNRTQVELNSKVNTTPQQQFAVPSSISYVIARPSELISQQPFTPTIQQQQHQPENSYLIKPQVQQQQQPQPYSYPTQISFGEFGDVLNQFKREGINQQEQYSENQSYQMPMSQI